MSQTYKYILLDWDGNLAMSLQNALDVYKDVFAESGLFPSDEEIITKAFGDWNPSKKFPIKNNQEFIDKIVADITTRMATVKLYPEVEATLRTLKQNGKKLAIVTSSKRETVQPALENLGLQDIFDCFLGKEDFIHEKPDPEVILKAMEKIGAIKDQTLIVGDSIKDVQAGKNAGITTVLFYPKENKPFYTPELISSLNADYLIKGFSKLLDIVK